MEEKNSLVKDKTNQNQSNQSTNIFINKEEEKKSGIPNFDFTKHLEDSPIEHSPPSSMPSLESHSPQSSPSNLPTFSQDSQSSNNNNNNNNNDNDSFVFHHNIIAFFQSSASPFENISIFASKRIKERMQNFHRSLNGFEIDTSIREEYMNDSISALVYQVRFNSVTQEEKYEVNCSICNRNLSDSKHTDGLKDSISNAHIDHIIPKSVAHDLYNGVINNLKKTNINFNEKTLPVYRLMHMILYHHSNLRFVCSACNNKRNSDLVLNLIRTMIGDIDGFDFIATQPLSIFQTTIAKILYNEKF